MEGKRLLVVIAAHHISGNIASQRFKAFLRTVDTDKYDLHVITRKVDGGGPTDTSNSGRVHVIEGECVGGRLGPFRSALVLLSAFFRRLPLIVLPRNVWLFNVVRYVMSGGLGDGANLRNALILATYSPIDALVAAKSLSWALGGRYVLDFRDGFVFESMGRQGMVASALRSLVERRLVSGSGMVLSVSTPLVDDLRRRYPGQRVELLPNGFDPDEIAAAGSDSSDEAGDAILADVHQGKHLIAHFGRIGASDATRETALRFFVASLNASEAVHSLHVLFVGTLTETEEAVTGELVCGVTRVPSVDRLVAIHLMRRVDSLLLITGSGRGCVTGKLFEYLAADRPVICFSLVENEAARIIAETGSGLTVVAGDGCGADAALQALAKGMVKVDSDRSMLSKYDRTEQAKVLYRWLDDL